jgi:hypothetical protein
LTVSLTNNFFTHARAITFEDTASVTWAFNASTNQLSATATGGGGGSGANPSASVGLAAVNGVATTFLRSDGAPALSQSIAPTWTGAHTFTPSSGIAITITAASGQQGISLAGDGTTYPFLCDGVGNSEAARFNSTNANGGFIDVSRGGTAKHWWGDAKALVSGTLDDTALRSTGKIVIAPGNAITTTFYNAGGIVVGSATGGNKGAGTINVAGGYYINGVSLIGSASLLSAIVQTGGASQTYTIPSSNMHFICAIAGGGGGQAGGAGAAASTRAGGGAGGGGAQNWLIIPTAALTALNATITVTFSNASGGTGGVGGTTATGAAGTAGSSVTLTAGSTNIVVSAAGAPGSGNSGGAGGAGNWGTGTSGGGGGNGALGTAGTALSGTSFFSNATIMVCTGGGGGGGVNSSNTSFAGGAGGGPGATGDDLPGGTAGSGGTTTGGQGQPGQSTKGGTYGSTGGGGGGGASTAGGTGGTGGAGGDYGGGGGGGGATTTGSGSPVSGSGGRGGYAAAIFLAW